MIVARILKSLSAVTQTCVALAVASIFAALSVSPSAADYSSPIFKDIDVRGVVKLPGTGYPYANAGGAVTYSTTIPSGILMFSPPLLGGVPEAISTTLARTVFVDQYAKCDGVTDDASAINSLFSNTPNVHVIIPAGKSCRAASTITVPGGATLEGMDFNAGNYPTQTSSRIVCDAGVSPCVQSIGGANGTTSFRKLVIGRAGGVPGSSTKGLYIQDNYNVILEDVASINHGICYELKAQVYNTSAGLGAHGNRLFSGQCVDAHLVNDSWAELKLSNGRFGMNAAGEYASSTYLRFKGGTAATAGGPNTVFVSNFHFGESSARPLHFVEFVNLGAGGVGGIDAREFIFDKIHVEALNNTSPGSAFFSDSTWNSIERFSITNSTFLLTGTPLFALAPETSVKVWNIDGNRVFSSTFSLSPTTEIIGLGIKNNWLQTVTTITAAASSRGAFVGNDIYGNVTISGAWNRLTTCNNNVNSGTYNISATGIVNRCDNGSPFVLNSSVSSMGENPTYFLNGTTASADSNIWRMYADSPNGDVRWQSCNDAFSVCNTWVKYVRSGASVGTEVHVSPILTTASTTTAAGINVPHGTAPTSPVNGDIWTTTTGQYSRINGATKTVADLESTQTFSGAKTFSGQITSTVATGTPPFVVSSASKVINLYSDRAALADTVPDNAITNAKAAQMPADTVKCNNTAGSANPIDCTASQATALLNVMVGDSGSGGVKGLVPPPAAGDAAAGKVLGAGGGWVVPTAPGAQNANLIYSGPASGAAASPSFRAQVCADLPPGAWCLLNTLTASNSASLSDTTSFTSSYHEYELVFENIVPSTNSVSPNMQLHTGGAYQNTNYVSSCIYANTAASGTCGSITTYIFVCAGGIANSSPGCSGSIRASNLSQTTSPKVWSGQFVSVPTSNVPIINSVGGYWNGGNGAIDGFQLLMSSGNITSGVIKVYGRK